MHVKNSLLSRETLSPIKTVDKDEKSYQLLVILFFEIAGESYKGHLISLNNQITLYYQTTHMYFSGNTQKARLVYKRSLTHF